MVRPRIAFAMTCMLLIGVSACKQGPVPLSDTDIVAIQQVAADMSQTARTGDWDRMVELFTDDAIRMPPNAPVEHGRETIRAHFGAVDSIPQWTVHESEIHGEGDLAYMQEAYTITAFLAGMPGSMTYTGKSLSILRRQPDGTWLIVMDIWNSDEPLGTPE